MCCGGSCYDNGTYRCCQDRAYDMNTSLCCPGNFPGGVPVPISDANCGFCGAKCSGEEYCKSKKLEQPPPRLTWSCCDPHYFCP
jgi:hypothetical protein